MNQSNLIKEAIKKGKEVEAGAWWGYLSEDRWGQWVTVGHYNTKLLRVSTDFNTVQPLEEGWGSISDKQGIRKILKGIEVELSYNELYEGFRKGGNNFESEVMKPTDSVKGIIEALGGTKSFKERKEEFNFLYNHLKRTDFYSVPPVYDLEETLNSIYRQVNFDSEPTEDFTFTVTETGEELLIRVLKVMTLLKENFRSHPVTLWARYKGELTDLKAVTV
jgi:hypothetical protein